VAVSTGDLAGAVVLSFAFSVAACELALVLLSRCPPLVDPCRERPSSLPDFRPEADL
jgi:hypothetical protein